MGQFAQPQPQEVLPLFLLRTRRTMMSATTATSAAQMRKVGRWKEAERSMAIPLYAGGRRVFFGYGDAAPRVVCVFYCIVYDGRAFVNPGGGGSFGAGRRSRRFSGERWS